MPYPKLRSRTWIALSEQIRQANTFLVSGQIEAAGGLACAVFQTVESLLDTDFAPTRLERLSAEAYAISTVADAIICIRLDDNHAARALLSAIASAITNVDVEDIISAAFAHANARSTAVLDSWLSMTLAMLATACVIPKVSRRAARIAFYQNDLIARARERSLIDQVVEFAGPGFESGSLDFFDRH